MSRKFNNTHSRIISGLRVEVEGNFEKAMRVFTKKVQNSGIMKELREREYFESNSQYKRRKHELAKQRWHKKQKESSGKFQKTY